MLVSFFVRFVYSIYSVCLFVYLFYTFVYLPIENSTKEYNPLLIWYHYLACLAVFINFNIVNYCLQLVNICSLLLLLFSLVFFKPGITQSWHHLIRLYTLCSRFSPCCGLWVSCPLLMHFSHGWQSRV